jgi:predicted Zn-dependent protease
VNAPFPLERSDLRMLAQVGFLAAQSKQQAAARTIFRALRVIRPDSPLPLVGLALADISAGRPMNAVRLLKDEGLREHPASGEIHTFLGWALMEAGCNDEAERVLRPVLNPGRVAGPYIDMARKLLSHVEPAAQLRHKA